LPPPVRGHSVPGYKVAVATALRQTASPTSATEVPHWQGSDPEVIDWVRLTALHQIGTCRIPTCRITAVWYLFRTVAVQRFAAFGMALTVVGKNVAQPQRRCVMNSAG
jgi:hypothetical protein